MAELIKKLRFKKNTTEQLAKAYSTTAEAGAEYITNKIDGVTTYIPIGATNDSRVTMGRVTKNGTKAILNSGKPPYTEKSWTSPGTYTFTVPQRITRIRVAVCGGGGGGALAGYRGGENQAGGGGLSKFGDLISATGGSGGYSFNNSFSKNSYNGAGGVPNGVEGSTKGFALSFVKGDGSYGAGGTSPIIAIGGSGGYNTNYVNVIANTTYSLTVGVGGKKAYGSNADATLVGDGTSGFVLIAYGGDI